MGRVSTSSPARDAERRRLGGTVLEAVLERITYANEETGYTIARVATDRGGADLLTVVGPLLGAQAGREPAAARAAGAPTRSTAGSSRCDSYTTVLPATDPGHPSATWARG